MLYLPNAESNKFLARLMQMQITDNSLLQIYSYIYKSIVNV